MTHLTPNIIGVVVPKDAFDIFLGSTLIYWAKPINDGVVFDNLKFENGFDFKILGTASPEKITFDFDKILGLKHDEVLALIESKGIILKPNEKLLILEKP